MKISWIKNDFRFWRQLMNSWSILFFILIITDFFDRNAFETSLNGMAAIYVAILAVYVSNKEFERWYHRHRDSHPGEVFVIIWTIIMFFLLVMDYLYESYNLPSSVISSYIAVITILAITRKSKQLYLRKRRRA